MRWVAEDAGLALDDAAIDEAIAQGAGSARDTLSALELIANAGGDAGTALSFDEFVEGMIDHDPGRALTAMAHAVAGGNDPRAVAEQLVRHLRNGFLALMAPELVQLSHHQVDELAAQAQRLGPAGLVRGIERLGEILVELRHAPDPRVLVEVALVQLTAEPAAAADDVVALAARVAKLEQAAASGPSAPAAAPPPRDPATGRAELGGRARRAAATGAPPPAGTARPEPAEVPAASVPADPHPPTADGGGDLAAEWEQQVRPTLKGIVRALFTPVDVLAGSGDTVTMAAPNTTHRDKCDQHRAAVEQAWAAATGRQVRVELTVGGAPPDDAGPAVAPAPVEPDDAIDLDDLVDAPPGAAPSALDRLAEAFPGAELVERSER